MLTVREQAWILMPWSPGTHPSNPTLPHHAPQAIDQNTIKGLPEMELIGINGEVEYVNMK